MIQRLGITRLESELATVRAKIRAYLEDLGYEGTKGMADNATVGLG